MGVGALAETFVGKRKPTGERIVPQPGTGPMAGEFLGSLVPGMRPITGAIGAAAGLAGEKALRGEPITVKDLAAEAGMSIAPEIIESLGRPVLRAIVRGTEGAKQIRFSEAARIARERFPQIFNPPTKQAVDESFALLRGAGIRVNQTSDLAQSVLGMSVQKFDNFIDEVARIDRSLKAQGRFTDTVRAWRNGHIATIDLGDLQTLRSELRKRAQQVKPFETKQIIDDFKNDIDEAIDVALTAQGAQAGVMPDLARKARRDYARLKASEEMRDFVEMKITSSPDIKDAQFNLRSFFDDLRRGRSRDAKLLNRALDLTPGARQALEAELDELSNLFSRIELPLADVSRGRRSWIIAQLGGWMSDIMLTTGGRAMFRQAVIQGRGRLSPNAIAVIANVARRELLGESSRLQSAVFGTPQTQQTEQSPAPMR